MNQSMFVRQRRVLAALVSGDDFPTCPPAGAPYTSRDQRRSYGGSSMGCGRNLYQVGIVLLGLFALTLPARGETKTEAAAASLRPLNWESLPALPDPIGVAGPFVGRDGAALIVAGGANFASEDAPNLWDVPKQFHRQVFVLSGSQGDAARWRRAGELASPVAYGASASVAGGVLCVGGQSGERVHDDVFLLRWDAEREQLKQVSLPSLPVPTTACSAAVIGDAVYVVGGQVGGDLSSATDRVWRLRLSADLPMRSNWEPLPPVPGGPRAFPLVAAQHNGFTNCLYVGGGRRQRPESEGIAGIEVLNDFYELSPERLAAEPATAWRRRADSPTPLMAGAAAAFGQSHVYVLAADDGHLLPKLAADPDFVRRHPGFPKRAWAYHTITDTWADAGPTPACPVTTPAVAFGDGVVLVSGEVRPRVRSPQVWEIRPSFARQGFGMLDYTVLVTYLLCMVGVGVYFMNRMKSTDDFFRGGQQMQWWAAGCSIFATMLSSITFMSIPAKAFAQDWVYAIGNLMIVVVAPVAVYLALPFFRGIDATSAYEYLELRFNRPVRLFASGLFSLFHLFRMAIVMSLAGLALAVVTPLTPAQSVCLMGVLSILYCTLGGVEAVIWTDTIQTFVLLGGALLCLVLMLAGSEGGLMGSWTTALANGKLHVANLHLNPTSANLAIWVVVLGGLGQNFSSYTSDQAVVQRYMTTPNSQRAAVSIWLAAGLAAIATLLFFALGSGLYVFYKSHPEKLDPTFTTDQIFPLFILNETFPGVAGLIVAGIFAAAQSTVSTSMNSSATTIVTDFLKTFSICRSDAGYLRAARWLTVGLGIVGTVLGLVFIDPEIKSLFDSFIRVIGIFMGVLGGLFALGMLTRTASGPGALVGVAVGATAMMSLPFVSAINGYLYPFLGIALCFLVGFGVSLVWPAGRQSLEGLTVFSQQKIEPDPAAEGSPAD